MKVVELKKSFFVGNQVQMSNEMNSKMRNLMVDNLRKDYPDGVIIYEDPDGWFIDLNNGAIDIEEMLWWLIKD